MTTKSIVAIAGLITATAVTVTWASKDKEVARGQQEILPVETVIAIARTVQPGSIVEVELEGKNGQPRYEIKVVDGAGKIHKLSYDARNGQPLANDRKQ